MASDPAFGLQQTCVVFFRSLVAPSHLTMYTSGEGRDFDGSFRVKKENGSPVITSHPGRLNPISDEITWLAVHDNAICLLSRRELLVLDRKAPLEEVHRERLPGRIPIERMVIPLDDTMGLIHIEGKDVTFGDLIDRSGSAIMTGMVLSVLTSLDMRSTFDPLTKVFGRRRFEQMFGYLGRDFLQTGDDSSIVMIDADHFKGVNDRYGHVTGDLVLASLAAVARKQFRTTDVVGRARNGREFIEGGVSRYGGEEFVALLPGTTVEGAVAGARRCRAGVERNDIATTEGVVINATVSMGVFSFGEALKAVGPLMKGVPVKNLCVEADQCVGKSEVDILMHVTKIGADSALYWAKEKGRNLVAAGRIIETEGGLEFVVETYK
ncbi:MAG: GGDEF domain-containing protein, partial [Candidatus Micrarchaeota archaeon]